MSVELRKPATFGAFTTMIFLVAAPAAAQSFPTGPANETLSSTTGQFTVTVPSPQAGPLLTGLGFTPLGGNEYQSPWLYGPVVVGLSAPGGTLVGQSYTDPVTGNTYTPQNSSLAGPGNINAAIISMDLKSASGVQLLVGASADVALPTSFGAVQSNANNGTFPATSFFDIFTEVELPTGAGQTPVKFVNSAPEFFQTLGVNQLPPAPGTVYDTSLGTDVPFVFANSGSASGAFGTISWTAGNLGGTVDALAPNGGAGETIVVPGPAAGVGLLSLAFLLLVGAAAKARDAFAG